MITYFTAADVPLSKASAGFTGQVPPEKDQKSLAWSMLLHWIYTVTCDSNDCSCSAAQWSVVSPVNTPPSSAVAVTSWSAAFLPVLSSSSSKCLWARERRLSAVCSPETQLWAEEVGVFKGESRPAVGAPQETQRRQHTRLVSDTKWTSVSKVNTTFLLLYQD